MSISIRLKATDRAARDFIPRPRPAPIVAVIIITLETETEDGPLRHETWAVGPTARKALIKWLRSSPQLAARYRSHRCASPLSP